MLNFPHSGMLESGGTVSGLFRAINVVEVVATAQIEADWTPIDMGGLGMNCYHCISRLTPQACARVSVSRREVPLLS